MFNVQCPMFNVSLFSAPSFADLDGDGDFDAFIGEASGNINYFENTGSSSNPAFIPGTNNPLSIVDVVFF